VIPVITKTAEGPDLSLSLRITAVQTIDGLAKKVNFSDHASRLIRPLVRVLNDPHTAPELATAILDTLSVLLIQLGADFAIFVPMINKVAPWPFVWAL
jgi:serine/threonine-protein kinase mTOR